MNNSNMLDELNESTCPSSALWALVQLRHDDLAQMVNHSKLGHPALHRCTVLLGEIFPQQVSVDLEKQWRNRP